MSLVLTLLFWALSLRARKPVPSAGSPSRPEPRSGRHRARLFRLLPILALLLGASGLFHGAPALAQNTPVWSGTLTVNDIDALGSVFGCQDSAETAAHRCEPTGALTDDDFSHNGVTYGITNLTYKAQDPPANPEGVLSIAFDKSIPDSFKRTFILTVGSETFNLADAAFANTITPRTILRWESTTLSIPGWSVGAMFAMSLEELGPPAAPTNLAVTPGDGKLELSWATSAGASQYLVAVTASTTVAADAGSGTDLSGGWETVAIVTATSHTVRLTNLQRYRVRVRASNAFGQSPWAHGEGTPEGLLLTGLALTKAQGENASYDALALSPGFSPRVTDYTAAVPHAVTHVKARATVGVLGGYTLSVRKRGADAEALTSGVTSGAIALDAGANIIDVKAASTFGQGGDTTWTVTVTRLAANAPAAPTGLTATPGDGRLDLTWTAPSGTLTGYDVHYTSALDTAVPDGAAVQTGGSASAADGWVVVSRSGTAASQAITGLDDGTTYRVRVRAENASGKGFWARATGTTEGAVATPAAPTGLMVTAGDAQLSLAWTAPSGTLTDYDVHYTSALVGTVANDAAAAGNDAAAAWVAVSRSGAVASQTISGLVNGETYRVRVRARNAAGNGAWVFDMGMPQAGGATPTVRLSASPNPVAEGSSVTVTATLSGALSRNVTIPVTVSTSGSNTAESTDVGTPPRITIASGATSGTGTITTAQDTDTVDETFTVALGTLPSEVTAGTPNSVRIRITDDDRRGGGRGGSGGGSGTPPPSEDSPPLEEPQDPEQSDDCADNDRENLVRLYDAADGDNWLENTNWDSEEPLRQWYGVDTDDEENVLSLRLSDNGLSGEIQKELLSCFSELKELALWDNEDLSVEEIPDDLVFAVERAALREIAEMLDINPEWFDDYEDPFSFEDWHEGVTTDEDGRVTELDLPGEIPESVISQFRKLREIMTTTGGGGCALSPGGSSAFSLFLLTLALFAALWRRRARG